VLKPIVLVLAAFSLSGCAVGVAAIDVGTTAVSTAVDVTTTVASGAVHTVAGSDDKPKDKN
jgi:hypothetical protein